MRKEISVVIDTNWWISLFLSKYKSPLTTLFHDQKLIIYRSYYLTQEICNVLVRPKFKGLFTIDLFEDFIERYEKSTTLLTVTSEVSLCRDEDDNFLLALAKDSKADFLITGDKDLLVLKQFENTSILTLIEFLDHLNKK
jgi:uncharacterized protein